MNVPLLRMTHSAPSPMAALLSGSRRGALLGQGFQPPGRPYYWQVYSFIEPEDFLRRFGQSPGSASIARSPRTIRMPGGVRPIAASVIPGSCEMLGLYRLRR